MPPQRGDRERETEIDPERDRNRETEPETQRDGEHAPQQAQRVLPGAKMLLEVRVQSVPSNGSLLVLPIGCRKPLALC